MRFPTKEESKAFGEERQRRLTEAGWEDVSTTVAMGLRASIEGGFVRDMTLRDFFAGCALVGLHYDVRDSDENRAMRAWAAGDAMLAERDKP